MCLLGTGVWSELTSCHSSELEPVVRCTVCSVISLIKLKTKSWPASCNLLHSSLWISDVGVSLKAVFEGRVRRRAFT